MKLNAYVDRNDCDRHGEGGFFFPNRGDYIKNAWTEPFKYSQLSRLWQEILNGLLKEVVVWRNNKKTEQKRSESTNFNITK